MSSTSLTRSGGVEVPVEGIEQPGHAGDFRHRGHLRRVDRELLHPDKCVAGDPSTSLTGSRTAALAGSRRTLRSCPRTRARACCARSPTT
jgi:hypothetical protein